MTYEEFISPFVISEEDFNELMSALPEIDYEEYNYMVETEGIESTNNIDEICYWLVSYIASDFDVQLDSVDFDTKEITVDIYSNYYSQESLLKFKNKLDKWTITNLSSALEQSNDDEEDKTNYTKKQRLINQIWDKANVSQIEEFVKTL